MRNKVERVFLILSLVMETSPTVLFAELRLCSLSRRRKDPPEAEWAGNAHSKLLQPSVSHLSMSV